MKNKMLILGIGAALFFTSCAKDKKDGQVGEPADVVTDSTAVSQPTATDSTHVVTSAQEIPLKMH